MNETSMVPHVVDNDGIVKEVVNGRMIPVDPISVKAHSGGTARGHQVPKKPTRYQKSI